MDLVYRSADGKIFETKQECLDYESLQKSNDHFERSQFFTSYGSKLDKYSSFDVRFVYIHPSEFNKMKIFLHKHNRSIKGPSDSDIYTVNCMTYQPIELEIERIEELIKKYKKEMKSLISLKQKITEAVC